MKSTTPSAVAFFVMFCLTASVVAGDSSDTLSWLTKCDDAVVPPNGFVQTLAVARDKERLSWNVSPDGKVIACCHVTEKSSLVKAVVLKTMETTDIYEAEIGANGFAALDLRWAPDCERLFIQFGFTDIMDGEWFPFDWKNKKILRNEERWTYLKNLPKEKRPDHWNSNVPGRLLTEFHPPEWSIDGKEYKNRTEALNAGVTQFFRSPREWQGPDNPVVVLRGVERILVCIDYNSNPPHDAYVIRDKQLLGTIPVVRVVGNVWFLCQDGKLFLRRFCREGRMVEPAKEPGGAEKWEYESSWCMIDLGKKKLEYVIELPTHDMLVQMTDGDVRELSVLRTWRLPELLHKENDKDKPSVEGPKDGK